MEIQVNGDYTLHEAHRIAEDIHDDIELHFPKVKHIMVHVNPYCDSVQQGDSCSEQ